jgi:hypothetical protein
MAVLIERNANDRGDDRAADKLDVSKMKFSVTESDGLLLFPRCG